jgi:transcriptional regulator of arginine metabolism
VEATQSTISRDIEELGLARVHDQQGVRYVAPGAMNGDEATGGDGPRRTLRRLLQSYALSMAASGNLLVIQTPPAAAHLLGEGIDRSDIENIVGTVAGDNTVLVVTREGIHAREIERVLTDIMKETGS